MTNKSYIKYNSVVNWGYCYNENLNNKGDINNDQKRLYNDSKVN